MDRGAKIVATIGPSSQSEPVITSLLEAGVNVARLNFSHGTHEEHAVIFNRLHAVAEKLGHPITILQDLQGPKIRTGQMENRQVEIVPGQTLILTPKPVIGNNQVVPVDFPQILESAKPGGRILLDDGNLELSIIAVEGDQVVTKVIEGGTLKSHKGVNLPGAQINIPGFTEKDESDLAFGLEIGVDYVAVSFVRTAEDIRIVRQAIQRLAPERANTPIIAKLERPEALDNLEAILQAADGVMVARGDLGVEMPPETVPVAQKRIIESANHNAKIVITATQMLDSMIHNLRPTRAEASDVANAILDGTDAVMLSGETASGEYPVQAVKIMNAIISQAETNLAHWRHWDGEIVPVSSHDDTYFITRAARELAHDRNVSAIVVFTQSGRTALLMSKARPAVPILAYTPVKQTYHRLSMYWRVSPFLVPHAENFEEMLKVVDDNILASTAILPGQQVVVICGFPIHYARPTNLALLHTVGEKLTRS